MSTKGKVIFSLIVMACVLLFSKNVNAAQDFFSATPEVKLNYNESDGEFYLIVNDEEGKAGGFNCFLDYDPSQIQINDVSKSGKTWDLGLYNDENGQFFGYRSKKGASLNESIVKVEFTLSAPQATVKLVNFTYDYYNEEGEDVEAEGRDLIINISKKAEIEGDKPGYQDPATEPTPGTTTTPTPSTTATPVPSTTSTPVPSATATQAPSTTGTPAPSATATKAPTAEPTKKADDTQSPNKHPQTGANLVIYSVIGAALFGTTLLFIKYKNND